MAFSPSQADKAKHVRRVGVDDIKFLLSESSELSPIGWVGNRVPFAPWSFESSKADCVRIGFAISSEARREDVHAMPLVAKLVNQELYADADSV